MTAIEEAFSTRLGPQLPLAEIGRRKDGPGASMIGVSYPLHARLRRMVRETLHPKSEGPAA